MDKNIKQGVIYLRCLGRLPDPCLGLESDGISSVASLSAFSLACRFKILFSKSEVVIFGGFGKTRCRNKYSQITVDIQHTIELMVGNYKQ
jgi:hypothetical protein